MSTIGLIAGGGRFPILFADSARKAGHRVIAVAHRNETDPALAEHVDAISWVKLGQIGHLVQALKAGGATQTVMLGAITKRRFFADAMLDATGLRVLARVAIRSDDNLLRAMARFLDEEGVPITDATPFLLDRLAPEGVYGRHEPTEEEWADARYGFELARGIGRLDLGQTVVVKGRAAIAVEAIEGTDACIRRGGELAKNGGFVVVKAVKPGQDRRFDLPAIGPDTVESLKAAKGRVLAVEAGATLVMDLPRMVELADRAGIALLGLRGP
jgi:UDP-2,3-diacylglucosamine hydrolase